MNIHNTTGTALTDNQDTHARTHAHTHTHTHTRARSRAAIFWCGTLSDHSDVIKVTFTDVSETTTASIFKYSQSYCSYRHRTWGSWRVRNVRRFVQVEGTLHSTTCVMGMRGSTRGCCVDSELLSTACLRCNMTGCGRLLMSHGMLWLLGPDAPSRRFWIFKVDMA